MIAETTDEFPLVGIYGGTFDPIHYGHLRVAEEIREIAELQRVIFVPSGIPRLRALPVASGNQRLTMVHLALKGNSSFSLDEREIHRSCPSTAIQLLREYKNELGDKTALCFMIGMDAFVRINQWIDWKELFNLCHFIIVARPGYITTNDLRNFPAEIREELISRRIENARDLKRQSGGFIFEAQTALLDISASRIRQLMMAGKSIRYLLPENVSDFIQSNELYTGKT